MIIVKLAVRLLKIMLLDMRPSTPLGHTSHDVFQANLVGEMYF